MKYIESSLVVKSAYRPKELKLGGSVIEQVERRLTKRKENQQQYREGIIGQSWKSHRVKVLIDDVYYVKMHFYRRIHKILTLRKYKTLVPMLKILTDDFQYHIESQFELGMSWSNYGYWHLKHVVPLSKFCLKNPDHLIEAYSFTNFKPEWRFKPNVQ